MKRKFHSPSWLVTYYDVNADKIKYYDVLSHRETTIKKLKKECETKEEFATKMLQEFMWSYWSKCQWEIIVEVDDNHRIWLSPWVGSRNPKEARIDVTDRTDFDWKRFADVHIGKQRYKDRAKVDVFDQLEWQWSDFIDYCWYTRLKYERDNPKFHK